MSPLGRRYWFDEAISNTDFPIIDALAASIAEYVRVSLVCEQGLSSESDKFLKRFGFEVWMPCSHGRERRRMLVKTPKDDVLSDLKPGRVHIN